MPGVRRSNDLLYSPLFRGFLFEVDSQNSNVWFFVSIKLRSTSLTDPERKSLSSELDTVNEFLNNIDEMTKSAGENPDEVRQARKQVAAAFIQQWKINRSRKYN